MKDKILYVLLGVLFVMCMICMLNKREYKAEKYTSPVEIEKKSNDIEFLENPQQSSYDLLGNEYAQEAFNLGFGMGPGIYGSGRHTAEMDIL